MKTKMKTRLRSGMKMAGAMVALIVLIFSMQSGLLRAAESFDYKGNILEKEAEWDKEDGSYKPIVLDGGIVLENGSFEEPVISKWFTQLDAGDVPGWNTTDKNNEIEIWQGYTNSIKLGAVDGDQFVELNANGVGTLYQELETVPGTKMRWSLWHSGRQGTDTMQLWIGDAGEPLIASESGEVSEEDNAGWIDYTSDKLSSAKAKWTNYTGEYVVPEGQTETRFAFVAISASGGSLSVGNLLDNIEFGEPAHLDITAETGSEYGVLGDTVTYSFEIANSGGWSADTISFLNRLDSRLSYKEGSMRVTLEDGTVIRDIEADVDKNNVLFCELGEAAYVSEGESLTLSFAAEVAASAGVGTKISNQAFVSYQDVGFSIADNEDGYEYPYINVSDVAEFETVPAPDVKLSMSADAVGEVYTSDTVTYTLKAENAVGAGKWQGALSTVLDECLVIDQSSIQVISGTGSTKWQSGSRTLSVEDVTLEEGESVSISFDVRIGTNLNGKEKEITNTLQASGVNINGNASNPQSVSALVTATSRYNISFDMQADDVKTTAASQTVVYGDTITRPAEPERFGYTFEGWYLDDTEYDFDTPVTSSLTLTARWEESSFRVIDEATFRQAMSASRQKIDIEIDAEKIEFESSIYAYATTSQFQEIAEVEVNIFPSEKIENDYGSTKLIMNGSGRHFYVLYGEDSPYQLTINLDNVVIGSATGYGGFAVDNGSTLTINGKGTSVMEGIGQEPSTSPYALTDALGIYANGGAVSVTNGSELTLKDITLEGNYASSLGGAIYVGDGSTLNAEEVILKDNESGGNGGGIAVRGASKVTYSGGAITANTAGIGGGASISMDSLQAGSKVNGTEFGSNEADYYVDKLSTEELSILDGAVNNVSEWSKVTGRDAGTPYNNYDLGYAAGYYSVTYRSGSGTGSVPADSSLYGTDGKAMAEILAPEDLKGIDEYYEFVEWNTRADGSGKSYDPGDNVPLKGSLVLYAIWERPEVVVTFDANGGSFTDTNITVADNKTEVSALAGETVSAPEVEHAAEYFMEWNTEKDGNGDPYDFSEPVAESVNVYAQWDEIPADKDYAIQFHTNGGTPVETKFAEFDEQIDFSDKEYQTSKTGYEFEGWSLDEDGNPLTGDISITSDTDPRLDGNTLNVYAVFTAIEYEINFAIEPESDSGTIKFTKGATMSEKESTTSEMKDGDTDIVTYDDAVRIEAVPGDGYEFAGWTIVMTDHDDPDEKLVEGSIERNPFEYQHITGDVEVTAVFEKKMYDVTFFDESGTRHSTVEVAHGATVDEEDIPEFASVSHTHTGWIIEDSEDKKEWEPDDGVTQDLNLYPVFSDRMYTVEFKLNGGTWEDLPETGVYEYEYKYGTTIFDEEDDIEEPVRDGYEFAGWYVESANTLWNLKTSKVNTDIVLEARWLAIDAELPDKDLIDQNISVDEDGNAEDIVDADGVREQISVRKADEFQLVFDNDAVEEELNGTISWKWFETDRRGNILGTAFSEEAVLERSYSSTGTYYIRLEVTHEDPGVTGVQRVTVYSSIIEIEVWAENYNVVFMDSLSDETYGTVPVEYLEKIDPDDIPEDPESDKSYYEFDDWYLDQEGKTRWNPETAVTDDIKVYAVWIDERVTVNYYVKGEVQESVLLPVGEKAAEITPVISEHETEDGWYLDALYNERYDFDSEVETDLNLYARILPVEYTVTFDAGDGQVVETQILYYGEMAEEPEDPVREGYEFMYWYAEGEESTPYDFGTEISGSFTLYAKWEKQPGAPVDLSVNDLHEDDQYLSGTGNPGNKIEVTWPDGSRSETTVDENGSFTVAVPDNAGVEAGATITVEEKNEQNEVLDTVTTKVIEKDGGSTQPVYHTVAFNSTGGTLVANQQIREGEKAERPDDPVKEGYEFLYWYPEGQEDQAFDFNTAIMTDITLYAKWQEKTGEGQQSGKLEVEEVYEGDKELKGTADQDSDIVVQWPDGSESEVKADGDGNWSVELPEEIEAGDKITIGIKNKDGDLDNKIVVEVKQHEPEVYTVSFNSNGGSAVANQNIKPGETAERPEDPVREGYKFLYWYESGHENEEYDFSTPVTGHLSLYAKWEKEPENGGSGELTVEDVHEGDKELTGTADPDSEIVIKWPDGSESEVKADGDGSWSVELPEEIEAGDEITVGIKNKDGDLENEITIKVEEREDGNGGGSGELTVEDVHEGDKELTGTADPDSEIVIKWPDGSESEVKADKDGSWSVELPEEIEAGDEITVGIRNKDGDLENEITIKVEEREDGNGGGSGELTVEDVHEGDKELKGTADPDSEIVIKWPDGSESEVKADGDGSWSVELPEEIEAGDEITVGIKNKDGDLENEITIKVEEREDGNGGGSGELTVEDVHEGDKELTGTADPDSEIVIKWPDGSESEIKADKDGSWSVELPEEIEAGDEITVGIRNEDGDLENEITIKVEEREDGNGGGNIKVDQVREGDKELTGTADPDSEIVIKWPDGSESEVKADKDGNWSVTLPDGITAGDEITVGIRNKDGDLENKVIVKVGQSEKKENGDIAVEQVHEGDKVLKGTADPDTEITIRWPDGSETKVKADKDGNWSVTLPDGITVGDEITVGIRNEDGDLENEITIKVKQGEKKESGSYTVDQVYEGDKVLKGTADPGTEITIQWPDGSETKVKADEDGNWSVTLPDGITAGDKIIVGIRNEDGDLEHTIVITVQKPASEKETEEEGGTEEPEDPEGNGLTDEIDDDTLSSGEKSDEAVKTGDPFTPLLLLIFVMSAGILYGTTYRRYRK